MVSFVFRADSSTRLGIGHMVRCQNLAIALREQGAEVSFICRPLPGNIAAQAIACGFVVHFLPDSVVEWEADAQASAALIANQGPVDWLVVDHYELGHLWERALANVTRAILAVDDLANRPHECAVLLDQNFYKDCEARYADLVPVGCRKLLGPRYAILSTAFQDLKSPQPRFGQLSRLFVFFGGTDPDNETSKAIAAIRKLGRADLAVDIVMSAANPHQQAIRELATQLPNAKCHVQIETIHELMLAADLALGAGGTATWERLRAGLPCITIAIADNQFETARDLGDAGYIDFLGESANVSVDDIASAIEVFATHPSMLEQMSRLGLSLVDGQGTRRVVSALLAT
jgi:UDP-2,4-diacetamido-2,4,6-trideoxy-beta-L-altropyranose hydrolase